MPGMGSFAPVETIMTAYSAAHSLEANRRFYSNYWDGSWKYRLMYDMQIKKKLFLFAAQRACIELTRTKVLDIGFGSGDILFTFDTTCELHGLDLSRHAVEHARRLAARKGYPRASFLQVDLDREELPFEDASFDLVICSHVLEHVADDGRMLQQIQRLLRRRGRGVILIPINERLGEDPNHARIYVTDGFSSKLKEYGFAADFVFESEYIWHVLSWFFLRRYHERIPLAGRILSGLINVPLALLPFRIHLILDRVFRSLGYPPRQAIFCICRSDEGRPLH